MPNRLEEKLKAEATQKFPDDKKRRDAYVYGTLQHKTGWRPIRIKKKASKDK